MTQITEPQNSNSAERSRSLCIKPGVAQVDNLTLALAAVDNSAGGQPEAVDDSPCGIQQRCLITVASARARCRPWSGVMGRRRLCRDQLLVSVSAGV
jgi:hypothetical protein